MATRHQHRDRNTHSRKEALKTEKNGFKKLEVRTACQGIMGETCLMADTRAFANDPEQTDMLVTYIEQPMKKKSPSFTHIPLANPTFSYEAEAHSHLSRDTPGHLSRGSSGKMSTPLSGTFAEIDDQAKAADREIRFTGKAPF
ncbi:hypothetical protein NPIL_412291 [Nephila pilipes]|uniref:Uncharacterized protein n=1 Tax=Nephila pilipes TaxID=299642 RepID=A0A8X6N6U8_NEPPI|nr:hypothetical protein NPIL_412291 [Nephila pilipes]